MWDFWSLNPESLHQIMILMSDRGTPYGFRADMQMGMAIAKALDVNVEDTIPKNPQHA